MPPWRRRLVTISANFAGVVVFMLGFRTRISGYENYAKGKELGAVRPNLACPSTPCGSMHAHEHLPFFACTTSAPPLASTWPRRSLMHNL